jgi:hypothetical protein
MVNIQRSFIFSDDPAVQRLEVPDHNNDTRNNDNIKPLVMVSSILLTRILAPMEGTPVIIGELLHYSLIIIFELL